MLDNLAKEIFKNAPDALVITNEKAEIVDVNPFALKLFGYAKEELIGREIEILVPDRIKTVHKGYRNEYLNHPKPRQMAEGQNLTARKKDATEFPTEISLTPIQLEDRLFMFTVVRDMTSKIKNERKFYQLIESAPFAILITNLDGKIEIVNNEAEQLFGCSAHEMIAQPLASFIPEFFLIPFKNEMGSMTDIVIKKKNGENVPAEISYNPIETETGKLIYVSIRDISQRKTYEKDLQISEYRFRTILDHAYNSFITTTPEGTVLTYNKASEKVFGRSAQEMIGKNIEELYQKFDKKELLHKTENHHKALDTVRPIVGKRQNGEQFPGDIAISTMEIEGELIYIVITRDNTEKEQLDQLKKEFISTVSHELRTPLTSIRGSIDLLLGGKFGELNAQARRLLEIASRNGERLSSLINEILDIEKLEAGKLDFHMEHIELTAFLNDVFVLNQPYAESYGVKFAMKNTVTTETYANADPKRLNQVLTNLISNAVKFSPKGGTVSMKMESAGDWVTITVEDQGPGVSQEFSARIFQRFSQLDTSDIKTKSGTGLGLYISKLIMDHFGGNIGLRSSPGKGSAFFIELKKAKVK